MQNVVKQLCSSMYNSSTRLQHQWRICPFHLCHGDVVFMCATTLENCAGSEYIIINGTHYYICGTQIYTSKLKRFVETVDSVLSAVLIELSILCLILQLVVFQQLSLWNKLPGKSVATFCATLLIAFFCHDIGPSLPDCTITAIVAHYFNLSAFVWLLIMSCDCWLSLYKETKYLREPHDGKEWSKYLWYCLISWTIPLAIVTVSVTLEFNENLTNKYGCVAKSGYGLTDSCFITGRSAVYIFYVIPTSVTFVGNILFLGHSVHMIRRNNIRSAGDTNPKTGDDKNYNYVWLYRRLALSMGVSWILLTAVVLTQNIVVQLLFTLANKSQGILIFICFTCRKRILDSLLQKYYFSWLGQRLRRWTGRDNVNVNIPLNKRLFTLKYSETKL